MNFRLRHPTLFPLTLGEGGWVVGPFDRQLNVKIQFRKYRQHRAW